MGGESTLSQICVALKPIPTYRRGKTFEEKQTRCPEFEPANFVVPCCDPNEILGAKIYEDVTHETVRSHRIRRCKKCLQVR